MSESVLVVALKSGFAAVTSAVKALTARVTAVEGKANAALPAANLTGVTKIAVVSALPGTPDPNTLYITTT